MKFSCPAAVAVAASLAALPVASAAPLNPMSFSSLGKLKLDGTNFVSANTGGSTPMLYTSDATYSGVVVSQGTGLPEIAVFTFDDVTIDSGVLYSAGNRAFALLSRGNLTLGTNLDIYATAGTNGGALGGNGPGAGGSSSESGGGAGFGGAGGVGTPESGTGAPGGTGGPTYGDLSVALRGGSGGGIPVGTGAPGSASGGGGAFELGATGTLSLRASSGIRVDGGFGVDRAGGGSGGGILLHGGTVVAVAPAAGEVTRGLRAVGGAGGNAISGALGMGGGGGGGRVTVVQDTYVFGSPSAPPAIAINVAGGTSPGVQYGAANGDAGVAEFRAITGIVPSGVLYDFSTPSTGYNRFTYTNLTVQAGGVAVRSGDFVNAATLSIEAGGTFVTTGNGSVSGGTVAMGGGTLVAPGGLRSAGGTVLRGTGNVVGPITFTAGTASLSVPVGGTLAIGDATRADGVNIDVSLSIGSPAANAAAAKLILNDADRAVIGDGKLGTNATLSAPNGITLLAGRQLGGAANSVVAGAFANNGIVNGPTTAGQFITFIDDVSGPGSFTGNVTFSDGLAPGSGPASVSLGTATFDATTSLTLDLAGSAAGTGYDRLAASGTVAIDGKLTLSVAAGYVPAYGASHKVITSTALTGHFDTITGIAVAADRYLAVTYDATSVTVTAALPGDVNLDRSVNFNDLLTLAQQYGTASGQTWTTADFTGDGATKFDDLLALAQQYGRTALADGDAAAMATGNASFAADWALAQSLVPEPTAIALLAAAGLVAPRKRRATEPTTGHR